jgi:O-antigen polymerase
VCRTSSAGFENTLSEKAGEYKRRLLLVGGIFAYVACFEWMYEHYLYPMWGYLGFDYNPPARIYLVLAWILSVTPSLWMPIKLSRPSQLAYWVLYIAVIIPSMFVPLYVGLDSSTEVAPLMLVLFAGIAITGSSYLLPLFRIHPWRVPRKLFWRSVACVATSLGLWMAVVFRHHLQIVSFSDVYDLRDAANDVAEGSNVNYAFMLLTGAVNPFLMGCGLYYRRKWFFVAGALGQLLVYSVGGTKGSILSVAFILGFSVLLKTRTSSFGLKMAFVPLALLGGMCLSYAWTHYDPGPVQSIVLFVVLMRVLSINGLLTAQYYDFFQTNPLTYFSHIKGMNWFVHYPYQYPIGQEIGLATSGTTSLDATAHFWATDGIGGLGLPGILLVSVLCALVFWALDSLTRRHDPRLIALVTTYAAYNLANISIFTTLLSGGLALLITTLYLMPIGAPALSVSARWKMKNRTLMPSEGAISPSP